jgi:uncharacterized protein YpuA (DUF1002 family)
MKRGISFHMKKHWKKFSILALSLMTAMTMLLPSLASADSIEAQTVVTLGKDLTGTQRDNILAEMGVDQNSSGVRIVDVTNQEEHQYLGKYLSDDVIGTKALSSAKIVMNNSGGISVKTKNITKITPSMYANAAITAGIKDADIYVTAPFPVSGTAGLTGIIKAFETATGQKIDENKKEVANEEIVVTSQLADQIKDPNKAVQFINKVKEEISDQKPQTPQDYRDIIVNVSNDFNVNLNQQTINNLVQYAQNFNKLDINWDQINSQLQNLRGDIKNILNSDTTQGIIDTIFQWLGDFFNSIGEFFSNASSKENK